MSPIAKFVRTALVAVAVAAGASCASYASAQEITPSQLAAALDVVRTSKTSQGFDNVLPSLAGQVENHLIRARPDLHTQITAAVEAMALKLADRRIDLDNDIARVWAKVYSEDELKTIAAFYKTPAGQKFLGLGPQVYNDTITAVKQWSDRVGAELLDKSREELKNEGIKF